MSGELKIALQEEFGISPENARKITERAVAAWQLNTKATAGAKSLRIDDQMTTAGRHVATGSRSPNEKLIVKNVRPVRPHSHNFVR